MYSVITRWTEDRKIDAHIINGRVEPTIHVYNKYTDETDSFVDYQGQQYSLVFEHANLDHAEFIYFNLIEKFNNQ